MIRHGLIESSTTQWVKPLIMEDMHPDNPGYYEKRFICFLRERHPRLLNAKHLVATRCRLAAQAYAKAVNTGSNTLRASSLADGILYEGLIFSRFDTIC